MSTWLPREIEAKREALVAYVDERKAGMDDAWY